MRDWDHDGDVDRRDYYDDLGGGMKFRPCGAGGDRTAGCRLFLIFLAFIAALAILLALLFPLNPDFSQRNPENREKAYTTALNHRFRLSHVPQYAPSPSLDSPCITGLLPIFNPHV